MLRTLKYLVIVSASLSYPVSAATVLFFDDFRNDTSALGKTTLVNWNVLNGSNVDVDSGVQGPQSAVTCHSTLAKCLDTQGSSGNSAGDIETKVTFSLDTGIGYDFDFSLVNGGGNNSALLTIGLYSTVIDSLNFPDGSYDLAFSVAAPQVATIRITDQGPNDGTGLYLTRIQLSSAPEPATLALVVGALAVTLLSSRYRQSLRNR